MLVIGLGKRDGASQVHKLVFADCARSCRPSAGSSSRTRRSRSAWRSSRTPRTCRPKSQRSSPRRSLRSSRCLLERARGLMGRLPFDQIDLLVVGELGKNYSGAGMDPNVIGRLFVETQPDFDRPS